MPQAIELKLLKVINALVVCGSVKTTAKLLNLSPAAISYSLKKLREITGEHLFIRTRSGMKPNATAYELSKRYQKYFATDIEEKKIDDPQEEDSLTVMTYSPIEMLLSDSISRLNANNYRYVFLPYTIKVNERLDNLINKNAYIDIGSELPKDKAVSKIKLFTSDISILASVNNTTLPENITCENLYHAKHAIWSSLENYYCENMQDSGTVEKYLQERNVAVVSGSIINMVELCARSNNIMLLPDVLIPLFTKSFAVKRVALPKELKMKYDCYMHFNNKFTGNEALASLVDDIIHVLKTTLIDQSPWF